VNTLRTANHKRCMLSALLAALVFLSAGCATKKENLHPGDPFEPTNRAMFRFNEKLDQVVMKPVAQTYVKVVPDHVRQGVRNFLGNVDDSWSFVNALLQNKREVAGQNLGRVLVNSFIGIGGIFDVASEAGIERQSEDLGQTLAVWGVPRGPYLVLPFFGPSTVRDGTGQAVWMLVNPLQVASNEVGYTALGLRAIDSRAQLLDVDTIVGDSVSDRYSFLRSAYLQRRDYQIRDGQREPEIEFEEDTADNASPVKK